MLTDEKKRAQIPRRHALALHDGLSVNLGLSRRQAQRKYVAARMRGGVQWGEGHGPEVWVEAATRWGRRHDEARFAPPQGVDGCTQERASDIEGVGRGKQVSYKTFDPARRHVNAIGEIARRLSLESG